MAATLRIFDQLFAPISCDEFRNTYFNKVPLYLEGNSSRMKDLFSIKKFFECLADCEDVRAVFSGLRQARIAPNDAQQMFDAGATICATGLERGARSLREVLAQLKAELRFTGNLSFRGYLSPIGAGFAPHYDPRIVTTLQIEGTKTWHFGRQPIEYLPLDNSPIPIPAEFAEHLLRVGTDTKTLNPGDVLSLPAGTIHWAESQGGSSFALNLAFDYIGDTVADHITNRIRQVLLATEALRSAAFLPLNDEDEILIRSGLERASEVLREYHENPKRVYGQASS